MALLAALCAAVCASATSKVIVGAASPLRRTLRPHLDPLLARLGGTVSTTLGMSRSGGLLARVREWRDSEELRVRQSGRWPGMSDAERRTRNLVGVTGWAGAGAAAATVVAIVGDRRGIAAFLLVCAGTLGGGSMRRGLVDRSIRARCERIVLELPTVAALLAMWMRTGLGVMAAIREFSADGSGELATELSEVIRMHRSGLAPDAALRRLAELTPEPASQRMYLLLANAEARGWDATQGLMALAADVRARRRNELRRDSTRRRAAMLLPIVVVLAPVLLLFVVAPLPWIVLRSI